MNEVVELEGLKVPYIVNNKPKTSLKLIPYIGCKAGFKDIFDDIIPSSLTCKIYDVFGGGGSFTFYACNRFGSDRVTYNDNNPTVVNLVRQVQTNPERLWKVYNKHYHNSSPDYYYRIRELDLEEGVEGAGNFLYLAKNAFSGKIRFNANNRFNSPIRKGSSCPKLDCKTLTELSQLIKDLTITNLDYREFNNIKDALLYLDPPYFNNSNGHYNGVLELQEFNDFLRNIETSNLVVLSEQNDPDIFELSDLYTVHPITLNRSLQYFTQTNSKEIIAFNYMSKMDDQP